MKRTVLLLTCVLTLAARSTFAANTPAPALGVTADKTRLTITNVASPAGVVLLGLTLQVERGVPATREFTETLRDEDGDGKITFDPKGGVPFRAVFIAVDRQSGAIAFGSRPEYTINRIALAAGKLKKNDAGEIVQLIDDRLAANLIIVRPGGGAWSLRAFEGGGKDSDHSMNGHLALSFEMADPLDANGDTVKHLKNGDVIAVIDPGHLQAFAVTIGN